MRRQFLALVVVLLWSAVPAWATTTWLVRQSVGSDTNGGTSKTIYQQGTDGATTNATRNFSSATANFTTGCNGGSCVNQGIFISNYRGANSWCQITTVTDATHVILASTGGCASADNASHSNATWVVGGPWVTIGKALTTTTPVTDGDSVYIGAGDYRETPGSISAGFGTSSDVSYIGDVDGVQTGDPGLVVLNGSTTNDVTNTTTGSLLTWGAARSHLAFSYLVFRAGPASAIVTISSVTPTNLTFSHCRFVANGQTAFQASALGAATTLNWTLTNNVFEGVAAGNATLAIQGSLTSSGSADWDTGITVSNNLFLQENNGTATVAFTTTGAGTFKPGGGAFYNNTFYVSGSGSFINPQTGWSTSVPMTVYNNLILSRGGTGLNAATSGQITEDYNAIVAGTARTNVTAGTHSRSGGADSIRLEGSSSVVSGARFRQPFEPEATSPWLGFAAHSGGPSTDMRGLPRPNGTMLFGESGTATSGAAKTLTNTNATFPTNKYKGWEVKLTGGTGSGQVKQIASNTSTVLTVDGNWKTNPDSSSTYVIYQGARASTGTCTAGATTTCTDSNAAWGTNQWAGFSFRTDAGTGSGQTATIASNTATVLTFNETLTALDNTTTYAIFRGTDENTPAAAAGAFERADTCFQSTVVTHTGTYALRCFGPATQDFTVPVDAGVSTTVGIWTQWDSAYAGTKPQLLIVNGTEAGVANASMTATGSAGAWEQLTLTFVPTSRGLITVRFQSNSTATVGSAYFDDWSEFPPPAANADEYSRRGEVPTDTVVPTILRARPPQ